MRDNYMMNYPLGLVPTGEVVEAKREGIYEPLKPKPLRGPHVGFRDYLLSVEFEHLLTYRSAGRFDHQKAALKYLMESSRILSRDLPSIRNLT